MDEKSPGTALVTKQDLRDLKEDLRQEFGRSLTLLQWGVVFVGGMNVAGILSGLALIAKHGSAASTASSAIHAIGKVVGLS